MSATPVTVVFAREAHAALLRAALPEVIRVENCVELFSVTTASRAVSFMDAELLGQFDAESIDGPVVAIINGGPNDALLPRTIRVLETYPWVSHVVSTSMITGPRGREHLRLLVERFQEPAVDDDVGMLAHEGFGRVALIARASRRAARFDRMREFFAKFRVSGRTIEKLVELAEELVMNALYDAPAEAGYFAKPRSRDEDVELPPDLACQISYGLEDGTAFVRVRDAFGALTRARLLQVLSRCNKPEVVLDESRGGAGLGMWRIFSIASTVAVTVVPSSLTEILVTVPRESRAPRLLQAVHLFFADVPDEPALVHDHELLDHSVSLILVA